MNFEETFDIIIINSVLHWIDRKNLLLSSSKIDRALKKGGILLIGDFQTPFPIKRRYHHIQDKDVFTYKQRYKDIFLSTSLYLELANITINHDEKMLKNITTSNMFVISLLRKESLYIEL